MKTIKFLFTLLNKKEKKKIPYVSFLILLNTLLEVLSIGILIPLVSIFINDENKFFFGINPDIYLANINISNPLILITILVGIIYIFKNLFIYFFYVYQGKYVRDIQFRVTNELYSNYLRQKYSFFLDNDTGTLIRNINSTGAISLCLLSYLTLLVEIILSLTMISYLLFLNFIPTILAFTFFLVFFLIVYKSSKQKIFNLTKLQQDLQRIINKNYISSFGLMKIIKIFNLEKKILNFLNKPYFNSVNAEYKTGLILQIPKLLIEVCSILTICFVILFMSLLQNSSNEEILLFLIVYAAIGIRLIPASTRIMSSFQRIKTYSPPLILLFNEFKKTKTNILLKNKVNVKISKIKLKNITIKYNSQRPVLKNISIEFEKNKIIGLIGESGSGKSSLMNVICGLIPVSSGKILFNEKKNNIQIPLIGYVPQDTQIFDDTIWNNVTFFSEKNEKNMKKFIYALKKVNLLDLLKTSKKDNYKEDLILGERGSKISGGQMQRVGIARAIFIDPEIYIFDEITSSLDQKNANDIINRIKLLKKEKIIIVISHNKKNLDICDKVFEIKKQKLVSFNYSKH
jgi:ABC-type multidrug transport system fused ATPase/permease subunit